MMILFQLALKFHLNIDYLIIDRLLFHLFVWRMIIIRILGALALLILRLAFFLVPYSANGNLRSLRFKTLSSFLRIVFLIRIFYYFSWIFINSLLLSSLLTISHFSYHQFNFSYSLIFQFIILFPTSTHIDTGQYRKPHLPT